jgi:hypothetical protein
VVLFGPLLRQFADLSLLGFVANHAAFDPHDWALVGLLDDMEPNIEMDLPDPDTNVEGLRESWL